MTINELKLELIKLVCETQDIELLNQMLELMHLSNETEYTQLSKDNIVKEEAMIYEKQLKIDNELIVGYTIDGKPLTQKDLIERVKQSERDFANGDFITQEDLEKESENW